MWSAITDIGLMAALACGLWVPVGRACQEKLGVDRAERAWSVSLALGMGIWGLCVLLLGALGLLYPGVLVGAALALLLALGAFRQFGGWKIPSLPPGGRCLCAASALLASAYLAIGLASLALSSTIEVLQALTGAGRSTCIFPMPATRRPPTGPASRPTTGAARCRPCL